MKTNAADKRVAILRAAFEVVTQRGYVDTKVDDVAQHAGVAKGTVYLYFRDKPDIYIELVDWLLEQALGVIRENAVRSLPARERLAAIFDIWSNSVLSRPTVIALLSMENINQTEKVMKRFRKRVAPRMQQMIDEIARIIDSGTEQGDFRKVDSRMAALTYLSAFRAAIFAVGNKWPVKSPGSTAMQLFFRGILAGERRSPAAGSKNKE